MLNAPYQLMCTLFNLVHITLHAKQPATKLQTCEQYRPCWLDRLRNLRPSQTHATFQHNILQHCCAQRVTRVWLPCSNMLQDVRWCWIKFENLLQHFVMLQDVARVWPAPSQHLTTRSNNVARCCVEMLRAFGRAFSKTQLEMERVAYPNLLVRARLSKGDYTVMYKVISF